MRLRCHLREIRGDRTIAEIARSARVPEAELSKVERGLEVPRDEWVGPLEQAYGATLDQWYPPLVLQALTDGQAVGPTPELLFRAEEVVSAREAGRGLSALVGRIAAGELEKAVILWRNKPRAVLLSIDRYTDLGDRR